MATSCFDASVFFWRACFVAAWKALARLLNDLTEVETVQAVALIAFGDLPFELGVFGIAKPAVNQRRSENRISGL